MACSGTALDFKHRYYLHRHAFFEHLLPHEITLGFVSVCPSSEFCMAMFCLFPSKPCQISWESVNCGTSCYRETDLTRCHCLRSTAPCTILVAWVRIHRYWGLLKLVRPLAVLNCTNIPQVLSTRPGSTCFDTWSIIRWLWKSILCVKVVRAVLYGRWNATQLLMQLSCVNFDWYISPIGFSTLSKITKPEVSYWTSTKYTTF
jgi:hypothetical protein